MDTSIVTLVKVIECLGMLVATTVANVQIYVLLSLTRSPTKQPFMIVVISLLLVADLAQILYFCWQLCSVDSPIFG